MSTATEEKSAIPLPATNGPRPYRCEICQRSFREVATLKKHEQLHRADRPYVCNVCGKSFLWSSNLKVHERVHTGERPYKCKICHRCFTQSNDLRRHERNVHQRGKLYSYKTPAAGRPMPTQPPGPTNHMNLAAYQAFALQQRAILQHALTYESLMQSSGAAMTTAHYLQQSGRALASLPPMTMGDTDVSTTITKPLHSLESSTDGKLLSPHSDLPLKMEPNGQLSPRPLETSFEHPGSREEIQSPRQSAFSPNSVKAHSPPLTSSMSMYGVMNGHSGDHSRSPDAKSDRPYSRDSHGSHSSQPEYPKYFSYPDHMSAVSAFQRNYHSAFSAGHHGANDQVIDLRINKSLSSADSEDGELDHWKGQNPASKSPGSESESDSKRAVTTTSYTPTVESGIHHCPHCNILFHDFTMYNLHQSLHSPMDEDPFTCPSCLKRCQDRIEFMFHIVWHVKYPHTIPKYQSFKETYLMVPEPDEQTTEEMGE